MGTGGYILRLERPECEADHPPLANAEDKNKWSYTAAPPYVLAVSQVFKSQGLPDLFYPQIAFMS
jgi:hypothetical protein